MNAPARNFTAALAVREQVPLLVGLMGPSGGGKTFSALRLATGIQQVAGGDIYMIDTEARRGLHYADRFKFKHVPFEAPFGSDDYLEALRFCVKQGAGVVIVDSMSHEHEGPGGLIDLQDQEMRRLAGDDYGTWKADRFNMLAWQKPKAARRRLINGLLQLNANFIFCFRAKETSKPVKKQQDNGRDKTVIEPMGFMPIAGDEFVYEMTMNALLLPGAGGLPTWKSENRGERMMMKLPEQFRGLMENPRPLDEQMGSALATWAKGSHAPTSGPGSDFPGDRGAAPRTAELTLAQRADAYEKRLREAPSTIKIDAFGRAAEQLLKDLDAGYPERKVELDQIFDDRRAELAEAEARGE
jgi:hypothetical protein